MRYLRAAGVYLGIVLATLVVAEAVARVALWRPSRHYDGAGDKLYDARYDHSQDGFGDLRPNQDGHWVIWYHRPYHVQTNSVGLRNTEEPRDDAFRVLVLGDSQTFGPYLANEDTWPAWMENAIRSHFRSATSTQVFNAGIAGYTILDEVAYLKDKGAAFRPDLVVIGVFENDLIDVKREVDKRLRRKPRSEKPFRGLSTELKLRFAVAEVVNDLKRASLFRKSNVDIRRGEAVPVQGAPAGTSEGPDYTELARRYDEVFDDGAKFLAEKGIPLAVVYIPAPGEGQETPPHDMAKVIAAAASRHNLPFLDLTPAMTAVPESQARLFLLQKDPAGGPMTGNGHLSREGNAVIGGAVANWLIEKSLVREGRTPGS